MMFLYFLSYILSCVYFGYAEDKFLAAVYEHVPIFPDRNQVPVSQEEALSLMNKNIDVLETAVMRAAQKGAHIIVTPEYAICCFGLSRETVYPYLEHVPEPAVDWIPCNDPQRFGRTPVQKRLSCIAKKNHIYLVANLGDKKQCNCSDPHCPEDGQFFYDTTVAFDPEGKLIARYHKYHLFFGETQFNVPEKPEISTFITPFGKFGIFICYDILFYEPAVTLVTQHNVDTIIFTTAWFNLLPHYSAIQIHSAWAMAMGINLLSSNVHDNSLGMTGSGVFSPDKLGPYYYNKDADDGQLVVSELKSHPRHRTNCSPVNWNLFASRMRKPLSQNNVFRGKIFLDVYNLIELKDANGNVTVCHNNLCCYLSYSMLEKRSEEVYVFGAYDGLHGPNQVFYVEVCTLLRYKSLESLEEVSETALTKFESFSVSGTFNSSHVLPEVLLSGVKLAPELFEVLNDGRLVSDANISSHALLSVTLLGRNYKKDPPKGGQTLEKFIGAVYEHAVILPEETGIPVSAQEALDLMNKNMDILEQAVKHAAEQGAHLIVTPEDGIYGFRFTREAILPYLEDIPDPSVNWIPCTDPERYGPAPVQTRLSCMAKHNSIYVVANIGDKKLCNSSDAGCPDDGQYNYNTAVVYDSQGKLVARYHKYNLFLGEVQFNVPHEPELVTFDTPFGKFGIFICFDILFYNPAVALVVEHNVDTILFPTAWMNLLPHLTAVEFHSAWAMGMGVNLLSANTHNTSLRMTGSGIFSPDKVVPYFYNMENEDGRLLISELNSHPRNSSTYSPTTWNLYASKIENYPSGSHVFNGYLFADEYTFTELTDLQGKYTVCQNQLCCHLEFKMTDKHKDEIYVLGVFDGLHIVEGQYYLQVCTLLKCQSTDFTSCGESIEQASTRFESFSLSGNFSTNFVFPEVLLTQINLAPDMFQVLSDGRLISKPSISSRPLLSANLFGRWYEQDPPRK